MNYINYNDIEKQVNENICETVGKIYKIFNLKYDIRSFSDLFLKSDFCKREFDTKYSTFQMDEDASEWYILKELKDKLIPKKQSTYDCTVEWIGYIYRYIFLYTGIQSNKLAEIISFDYLYNNYILLSNMDNTDALNIILEDNKQYLD